MRDALFRPTRAMLLWGAFLLLLAVLFMPLRFLFAIGGDGNGDVQARQVRGTLWHGRMDGLMLGPVSLGDVNVGVSPLSLLAGQMVLHVRRDAGQDARNGLAGSWIKGFRHKGMAGVSGTVPVSGAFGPVPVYALEFSGVTARFTGDLCAEAAGRLTMKLSGHYAGLNLSQGLSGPATCEKDAVLFSLVSQTGMERLSLRIHQDGRYEAAMAVKDGKDGNPAALTAAGLTRQVDGDYGLTVQGHM